LVDDLTLPHEQSQSRKRRRTDVNGNFDTGLPSQLGEPTLPTGDLLHAIVRAYFSFIQPWIPILHEDQFRRQLYDGTQLDRIKLLLHAIVVAAIRYVNQDIADLTPEETELWTENSRRTVITLAMNSLTVESLQALTIIAFSDVSKPHVGKTFL
jgi:hypothetical protein